MHQFNFSNQGSVAISSFNSDENHRENNSKFEPPEELEPHSGINNRKKYQSEQRLEQLISNLLRYSVIIAYSTVFVGGVLYLVECGVEPAEYQFFQGQPSLLDCPRLFLKGIFSCSYNSIIIFGILLLIAIPVIRVALSLFTFIRRGDFIYTVMTLLALSGLIYSFIRAYY